jgi:pSer/pThr/pTyr-binding forkhead associated (FHA) protein
MRDGRTRQIVRKSKTGGFQNFIAGHTAKIIVVSGNAAGHTFTLSRERTTMGRGPGVDQVFDNPEMSRQHAMIEFSGDRFHVRDLGSTNGIMLNGRTVQSGPLSHGDRFQIGPQVFQLVIEETDAADTYELTPGM